MGKREGSPLSGEAEGGSLLCGEAQGRERRFSGVWGRSGTREKLLHCLEKLTKAITHISSIPGRERSSSSVWRSWRRL